MIPLAAREGLYKRVFLPQTILVPVGQWGERVCRHFFSSLQLSYSLRSRGHDHPWSPDELKACFGSIAISRLPGAPDMEWARHRIMWPEVDESDSRLEVHGTLDDAEFWSVPRASFERLTPVLYRSVESALKVEIARVGFLDHLDGCRALGVEVPEDLANQPRWIIIVGSLWEPEVASVVRRLPSWLNQAVPGVSATTRFLYLVDAGAPDRPRHPREPWTELPHCLCAQFLNAIENTRILYPEGLFVVASPDARGTILPEAVRTATAAGILRGLFWSRLFAGAPRPAEQRTVWNKLTMQVPGATPTTERTGAWLEVGLNLDALPSLMVRESMSGWAIRCLSTVGEPGEFNAVIDQIRSRVGRGEQATILINEWLNTWAGGTIPWSHAVLLQLRAWLEAEVRRVLDEAPPLPPPAQGPLPWWKRILIFLRLMRSPTPPPLQPPVDRRKVSEFYDELHSWVCFCLSLLDRMEQRTGEFEPTVNERHYDLSWYDDRTLMLRPRRLPLTNDCPPRVRDMLLELQRELPELIMESTLASGPDLEAFLHLLSERIEALVRTGQTQEWGTAEQEWNSIGVAQWIGSNPQLAQLIAGVIKERFVPLWRPLPNFGWEGRLTVFDFGAPLGEPLGDSATESAWLAVLAELRRIEGRWIPPGTLNGDFEAFDPKRVLWVRWPGLYRIGLLWTEFQGDNRPFRAAWSHADSKLRAADWMQRNPEQSGLIGFSDDIQQRY